MVVQCCVCKKVREGRKWTKPEYPLLDKTTISHGYCPNCADDAFREVREYHRHNLRGLRAAEVAPT